MEQVWLAVVQRFLWEWRCVVDQLKEVVVVVVLVGLVVCGACS